jgi:hypothetical protein
VRVGNPVPAVVAPPASAGGVLSGNPVAARWRNLVWGSSKSCLTTHEEDLDDCLLLTAPR